MRERAWLYDDGMPVMDDLRATATIQGTTIVSLNAEAISSVIGDRRPTQTGTWWVADEQIVDAERVLRAHVDDPVAQAALAAAEIKAIDTDELIVQEEGWNGQRRAQLGHTGRRRDRCQWQLDTRSLCAGRRRRRCRWWRSGNSQRRSCQCSHLGPQCSGALSWSADALQWLDRRSRCGDLADWAVLTIATDEYVRRHSLRRAQSVSFVQVSQAQSESRSRF